MTRRVRVIMSLLLAVAGALTITSGAWAGGTVSPGENDRFAAVEVRCPTFSWEAAPDADAFELVVFALPPGLAPDHLVDSDLSPESEVLYARVGGGASAWTPPAERCFDEGGRFAWFVRPVAADTSGEWSAARFFAVPASPTAAELRQALGVLQRWSVVEGGALDPLGSDSARPARPMPAGGLSAGGPAATAKSIPTAVAAIRGDSAATSGENYGLVGTSASADGAGIAAANTGGGPDLVLDGSLDGTVDTLLRESGIDRRSPADQRFDVSNSGAGSVTLYVEGRVEAAELACPDCVASETIADGSIATADLAVNAVDSTRILNSTIQTVDLADDVINTNKIIDGAVRTADILSNAVTSPKIADGAVGTADLSDGAVTSAKIHDGTITAADIDPLAALPADTLDGEHGAYYRNASNLNAGTVPTARYSAIVDLSTEGYLGDASGDIPMNNSQLQQDLNADLLDGQHAGSFQHRVSIGTASVQNFYLTETCDTVTTIGSVGTPDQGIGVIEAWAEVEIHRNDTEVDNLWLCLDPGPGLCYFNPNVDDACRQVITGDVTAVGGSTTLRIPVYLSITTTNPHSTYWLSAKMTSGYAFETDRLTRVNVRYTYYPD